MPMHRVQVSPQSLNNSLLIALLFLSLGFYAMRWNFCFVIGALMLLGIFFLGRYLNSVIRMHGVHGEGFRGFQEAIRQQQHARANIPRQIFWLLFTVAEADGGSEVKERELVRRFLLERFPNHAADLQQWEAERLPPEQVAELATGLGKILTISERETVFCWCCLVAFADDRYQDQEHKFLQRIAQYFGLQSEHARRLFNYAKQLHLNGHTHGSQQSQAGGNRARSAVNDRSHALQVLGLKQGASKDDPSATGEAVSSG